MHALIDFIRGNIEREGENQGMIAALRANSAGYNPAPAAQQDPAAGAQAAPGPTAQDAPDTSGNPSGEGQNIGDMIQAYSKNKAINSAAQADTEDKLTQLGQSGRLGNVLDTLPDDGKKLLEKYQKNGGGSITDSIKLNGMLNAAMRTSSDLQKQQIEGSRARIEQIQAAQQTMRFNASQAALQRLLNSKDISSDPMAAFAKKYADNYGTLPPPEMMEKVYQQVNSIEKPVGVVYNGAENDPKTGPMDVYQRVYRRFDGNTRAADVMKVPAGAKPPGTLLDSQTFQPTDKSDASAPSAAVMGSPDQQKAIEEAAAGLADVQQKTNVAQQLSGAVNDYVKSNPSGNRTNAFMGTPRGLALRSFIFADTSGQNLEGTTAQAAVQLLQSAKTGGRLNQKEFESIQDAIPQPTDPNDVLIRKATILQATQDVATKRAAAYLKNLKGGMQPGDAQAKAVEQIPMPDFGGMLKKGGASTQGSPRVKDAIYTDKNGNRARWDGEKFTPL